MPTPKAIFFDWSFYSKLGYNESLEGLMDFLIFLIPKLWSKYCN